MILLNLPDVEGDSEVEAHKNWIALNSFSFTVEREFSESAKAGTADINLGIGEMQACECGKSFDRSSVYIMKHAISGASLGTAEVHFLETARTDTKNPKPHVYMAYKLDNAFISKWDVSGDEDDRPNDNFSIWFAKLSITYWTTKDGKTFTKWGPVGWDRVKNESWDVG
jgi:type VI secretion system secreted protein Hcp